VAGIGFELRKHLRKESYTDLLRAYLVAGVVGSGPWAISIGSMLFIGVWTQRLGGDEVVVKHFLATVTYLMAASLIVSGFFQLLFVRFIADRLFEKREDLVGPNILGALLMTTLATGALGTLLSAALFHGHYAFRVYLVAAFVALSDVWMLSVLMSGMKAYAHVFVVFAGGYAINVVAALALSRLGLAGYLAGFFAGQVAMLFAMLILLLRQYPSRRVVAFDFLKRRSVFIELAFTGGLFNIAVWADKFVFWANPATSEQLIGPIRYSVVYDVPIFLAYLSVIPGMSVFLVRIETDFAEHYDRFYTAVREGDTLDELQRFRDGLVEAARAGIYDICRVQGMAALVLILIGARVLAAFHIPAFYSYLFKIDVVGVGFQVVLLGIFTILFYLDYRKLVLYLCAFFASANVVCSLATLRLGPRFYGYGFAVAAAVTSLLALGMLSRRLDRLEYETFMR
jgi:uncharacterized membrane protein